MDDKNTTSKAPSGRCPACRRKNHLPHWCHNNKKPLIDRTCTCDCQRRDFEPTPYWAGLNRAGAATDRYLFTEEANPEEPGADGAVSEANALSEQDGRIPS